MSNASVDPAANKGVDLGALSHAIAGVCALVLGGLMYSRPWAQELFALLMIAAAASAVYVSWKHSAWATGHWLAMVPVFGVMLGYIGWEWGFTLAYVTLWIAFTHFVTRGIQSTRPAEGGSDS